MTTLVNKQLERKSTSVRMTAEALRLLAETAYKLGMSQSACLELAVRDLAKKRGVA